MLQPHRDAAAAGAPGGADAGIGHRNDRRAVTRLEIHPGVHPAVAEDRMATHPEIRCHRPWHRREHPAALFAHARGFIEPAVLAPAHQLGARLAGAIHPGIEQLARLAFAGGGAAIA